LIELKCNCNGFNHSGTFMNCRRKKLMGLTTDVSSLAIDICGLTVRKILTL
jgi:hypothetical protein